MKNIKNQKGLFSLCYQASKKVFPNHLTRNLLMVYMATYITHILTLRCISLLGFNFQINSSIFIGITCLNGLFVLQSLLFLIIAQLKLFRYALMDRGINFIVRQVINPTDFSSTTGILMLTFTLCINFIMVTCISYEDYEEKALSNFNFSFSFYLFLFSFLLQIIDNTQIHALKSVIICCLLYSLYNSKQNLDKICIQKQEKAFIAILVNLTLIITTYILFQHIVSQDINQQLYYLILLCVYLFIGILFHQRKEKMLKIKDFQSIKDDQAFLCKIQAICFDIDGVLDGNKNFSDTELNAYLSHHDSICKLPSCPLFGEESKNQLREPHQTKNIKNVLKKLKKHLQLHFEQRCFINGQSNTLSFGFLRFLIIYSKHKRKALELYNTLSKNDYSIGKSYQLYRLKVMIDELQDEESLKSMKSTNILLQNYHELSSNIIESFHKICGILLQEKIDINLLTSFTHQLSHQRQQLDHFIQGLYSIQTFGAYKILTLYRQCCRQLYHEQKKAQFIQKHLESLIERLDHKKQVQFCNILYNIVSNRSQVGLVAISLSQNSLGNVFSINQYAQSVFGFDGKDIIGKSVNNIMPVTFASYHDSLLMVFLKNRYKKVNGDERVLIGKNKSGLIFPVMLRLQRVIASSDELVFVANIRKYKTKESPIMFIVTPQGEVVDYSAGFQFYFMKNSRIQKFNIYEVSPNFGDISQDNLTTFNISCQFKTGTVVSVNFKVTPLVFFGNLSAYYLFGTKTSENSRSLNAILPITIVFSQLIDKARLNCHYNNFFSEGNTHFYTMQSERNTIDPRASRNRQLTIPFIHMDYFSSLIQNKPQQDRSFNKGIRTIRLVNKHFQPVEQASQFSSQQFTSQQKNVFSSNKKIVSINQLEKSYSSFNNTEKVLLFITFFMILVNIFSFQAINTAISSKNNARDMEIAQYEIKQYIADFILFSNFKKLTYNQEIFLSQFNTVKTRIIHALQTVQLLEQYKECYYRIIYSENTWKTIGNLFSRPLVRAEISQAHLNAQYMNISLTAIMVIVLIFYICLFKQKILNIYSYFLCLDERLILDVISKCEKINKLTSDHQDNVSPDVVQGSKDFAMTDDNQPSLIKKIKYFHKPSRKHDILYVPQLFLFVVVIGVLIGVIIAQSKTISAKFDNINAIQCKLSLIGFQSSQLLLSSFLSQTNKNTPLHSNFASQFQTFENQIIKYLKSNSNSTIEDIFNTFISGNICNSKYFQGINSQVCSKTANNISTQGIFSALDFVHTSILEINAKNPEAESLHTLSTLTLLQYQVIQHAINIMDNILKDIQTDLQYSLRSLYYIFAIIIMAILIIQYIFLRGVPFKNMKRQIQLVFHIIELFQSIKNKQEKSSFAI